MFVLFVTKYFAFSTLITLLLFVVDCESQCVNAGTSEGDVTLQEGGKACAPLESDETESDKGKRFVTCTHGNVVMQLCPSGLRFNVPSGICDWPQAATCQIDGVHEITPPVGPCNANTCKIPDCFCLGHSPTGVPLEETPMFIMLTFDDRVSTSWYNKYFRALAVDNDYHLHNPSGKRPNFAFYITHTNTHYTKVKALWEAGHEIGSHTIHHRLPAGDKDSDYQQTVAEIQGLKDNVLKATRNQTLVDSILGFRAPYLRAAGNIQYDVLQDFRFLYDSSPLNTNILQGKTPHWPFTLDYVMEECINPPCPTKPYPGMWLVPLNGWVGDNGQGCGMADGCQVGTNSSLATEQQWYDYYRRHFEQYFYPQKVPMSIFIHATLFDKFPRAYTALILWLQDTLMTHKDVWLVNPARVIQWMQNQQSNQDMIAQKWG